MKSGERRERTVDVPDAKRSVAATFYQRAYPSLFCSFTAWLPVRKRLLHYCFSYFASIVFFPIPFLFSRLFSLLLPQPPLLIALCFVFPFPRYSLLARGLLFSR
ncbi:hypothetical protein F3P51_16165 [Bacteroides fragilis]|uniref:Transmembrane protein n=1 Tax=Bacteroides fragilis TaxID=817 RepID=A0A642KUM7_BACFG|nr:hypothetical protein F2Z40_09895 [Bacteroides fragilis]KAA5088519.1 hypothetical protein F2Z82_13235 [Bacteroides fragilis]KAA5093238.1 hypothetical protein F2Z45_05570 [Bacteroides fragilis]KAA5105815.1 hypothetical protein F2Z46_03240 [Bacteroides fragilis]KAA5107966.1 hypothetical protein F2Z51_08045 [Bacteroides fragilis]